MFIMRNPGLIDEVITHVPPARDSAEDLCLMDEKRCGKVIPDFDGSAPRVP